MINEIQKIIIEIDEKFKSGCEVSRFDAINSLNNAIWLLQCKKMELMNSPIFLQDQKKNTIIEKEDIK